MKKEFLIQLHSLTVFRNLLKDPVIEALCEYLKDLGNQDPLLAVSGYCQTVGKLYLSGESNFADYIQRIVNDDENVYIQSIGQGKKPAPFMEEAVLKELEILQKIADLTPQKLREDLSYDGYLPAFEAKQLRLAEEYNHRCANIHRYGYGMYARFRMFYVNTEGRITPVHSPDPIRLSELIDYKREQQLILDNTNALLEGKPAANILLTGDAGTGKSSTIKAVVNELYDRGLRILEIRKEQLHAIPAIVDELSKNPLKFVLFIDDLSFVKDDDNFSALKAILEGSVSAKSSNVVIYATSNRRHLVKEKFSDRDGDDVHRNDTMQEIISLSERFGLQITFNRPDKKTYLNIVSHLAEENGIRMPEEELLAGAERFVLGRGNRSARAAKQYVDSLLVKKN